MIRKFQSGIDDNDSDNSVVFTKEYSLLIENVCHLKIVYISPQYRVVFNNLFQIVFILVDNNVAIDAICTDLWDNSRDWYAEPEYEDSELVYKPLTLN